MSPLSIPASRRRLDGKIVRRVDDSGDRQRACLAVLGTAFPLSYRLSASRAGFFPEHQEELG
jgi:hypothetical protein